ncbi:YsaB family lipoprotein [Cronobacter sakazakii]|uniref:YsaB family lipoprotein n=1 Tax=Cronobacter sakazakii TaxID=28141 RepID=UPI000CFBB7F6|nr:YsaB family lipoprotein [Cronobacter sakazakii]EMA4767798.1 YsaB family lipoprotein [Cronobacter sakazakii]MDK1165751.1 YsaB family lipoprotein [Cronobacter sakazakii]
MTRLLPRTLWLVLFAGALAGCSHEEAHPQHAQKGRVSAPHSLEMEQQCKAKAAHRYNTDAQNITVNGFEAYQGSYEMRGYTAREEGFTCSFDANGQFLHLSMR